VSVTLPEPPARSSLQASYSSGRSGLLRYRERRRVARAQSLRALDLPSARVVTMERIAKTATALPHDAAPAAGTVLRIYIHSWEIHGGALRPVVGQRLSGYRVTFGPSEPQDLYGLNALEEDVNVDALPPHVVVSPRCEAAYGTGACTRSGISLRPNRSPRCTRRSSCSRS
jgi:hypothetical protein